VRSLHSLGDFKEERFNWKMTKTYAYHHVIVFELFKGEVKRKITITDKGLNPLKLYKLDGREANLMIIYM